jgi:hypothetical protein
VLKRKAGKNTDDYPADWVASDTYTMANGRELTRGDEFTVRGEAGGTFRFVRHVRNGAGMEWVDCVGGTRQHLPKSAVTTWRSFRPDRITVLRRVTQAAKARARRAKLWDGTHLTSENTRLCFQP